MRTFLLFVALIAVAAGCKRGTKSTGTAREVVSPKVTPSPSAPLTERKVTPDAKKDEPNWLKDERIPPKKDQLPADGSPSDGKTPWGVGGPAGGFQQPPAGAQPNPAGASPAQPPAPAAAPPPTTGLPVARVTEADMKDVWTLVENRSGATGRMPSVADTYTALVAAQSPAAAFVKDGAIILTSPTARESVWAYEARAYLSGGLVVTNSGVETMTATELKRRLGK